MNQQTETAKTPGKQLTTAGLVIAAIGAILCVATLFVTHVDYVGGRMVETQGAPTPGTISIVVIGLILAAIGYARRMLAAVERR